MRSGINEAIKRAKGVTALSRLLKKQRCKVSRQAIHEWRLAGLVPPKRVLKVEAATGVHRSLLNEKLYPPRPKRRKSTAELLDEITAGVEIVAVPAPPDFLVTDEL